MPVFGPLFQNHWQRLNPRMFSSSHLTSYSCRRISFLRHRLTKEREHDGDPLYAEQALVTPVRPPSPILCSTRYCSDAGIRPLLTYGACPTTTAVKAIPSQVCAHPQLPMILLHEADAEGNTMSHHCPGFDVARFAFAPKLQGGRERRSASPDGDYCWRDLEHGHSGSHAFSALPGK